MTTVEQELREALANFMRAASDKNQSAVTATLSRLTELQRQLGPDASPMLVHYLERRSYQKALDFLNSGHSETEAPRCGQ